MDLKHTLKGSALISMAAVMLLSGCGDKGSSSTAASAPAASSAPASTPASSAAASAPESAASAPASSAAAETSTPDASGVPQLDGYNLLWNDEFDGTELDESIWSYDVRPVGWTNNELQSYEASTDNVFLRDGKLVLKALTAEANGTDHYTSGKIKSQGKKDFTYGKVVVSGKSPVGKGLWPAIWMMPTVEEKYGQWPKCGEIDIMEVLGHQTNTAYCTLHWGEPHGEKQDKLVLDSNDFAEAFHEYSVEWEPGEIRWYIDGQHILTANDWFSAVNGEDEKPYPAPFDQDFFVQINLAVGGNWPGDPDASTDFDKAEFEVDYVRVYQKDSYDTNVQKPAKDFREPDENGNLIFNGTFNDEALDDEELWTFHLESDATASAKIENNSLIITTEKSGDKEYSVQVYQPCLPMYKGKKYRITFDAKAEEARDIIVGISAPNAGWIRYFPDTHQDITTEMTTYTFEFEMTEKDDNNGRLEFNLGSTDKMATVTIQNVKVEFID